MYNLPYFKETDQKVVLEFIHEHPLLSWLPVPVTINLWLPRCRYLLKREGINYFVWSYYETN